MVLLRLFHSTNHCQKLNYSAQHFLSPLILLAQASYSLSGISPPLQESPLSAGHHTDSHQAQSWVPLAAFSV
ncbi:hypothetical protein AMECASPLE_038630 [Ameca splendens]|uniref:Uncharacterized protein n=1 Tax=Ameca splendens TaxID=208324 RepID=A0ABV0Y899_9TELE